MLYNHYYTALYSLDSNLIGIAFRKLHYLRLVYSSNMFM